MRAIAIIVFVFGGVAFVASVLGVDVSQLTEHRSAKYVIAVAVFLCVAAVAFEMFIKKRTIKIENPQKKSKYDILRDQVDQSYETTAGGYQPYDSESLVPVTPPPATSSQEFFAPITPSGGLPVIAPIVDDDDRPMPNPMTPPLGIPGTASESGEYGSLDEDTEPPMIEEEDAAEKDPVSALSDEIEIDDSIASEVDGEWELLDLEEQGEIGAELSAEILDAIDSEGFFEEIQND